MRLKTLELDADWVVRTIIFVVCDLKRVFWPIERICKVMSSAYWVPESSSWESRCIGFIDRKLRASIRSTYLAQAPSPDFS
jgi:hypothetical protein